VYQTFLVVHFYRRHTLDEERVEYASDMGLYIARVRRGCSMSESGGSCE